MSTDRSLPQITNAHAMDGLRVAIYARKSTEQKRVADESKSVTFQLERARGYAAAKGLTLTHEYVDDAVSGAEFERRKELMRLLNDLKPGAPFDVLIVYNRDRIGREQ